MKILVPVKRVIDYNVKVRVKPDNSSVELANVKMAMNPFDEIAVEQALRIKEAQKAEEVIAVSIGLQESQDTIRTALAMGADRGILVKTDQDIEPLSVAKVLKSLVEKENPSLVILGKQAIDDDCNQTAQMLSALLNWPQSTFISNLEINSDKIITIREVDGGLEHIESNLPAIISVDLRLNEPRYASLPNIMKAKRKPIEELSPEELNIDAKKRFETIRVDDPPSRKAGVILKSVEDLVEKLKNEAKVI